MTPASPAALGSRDLAAATGVSTDTLRHYERKGLLDPPPRTSGGYRRYPASAVRRVRLIRQALAIGFSLEELARVLDQRRAGGAPCRAVRALVGERLDALDQRLADLRALRRDLRILLTEWDDRLAHTPPGRRAHLLDMLADRDLAGPQQAGRAGLKAGRATRTANGGR